MKGSYASTNSQSTVRKSPLPNLIIEMIRSEQL